MPMRVSRDPGRRCDACAHERHDCQYIAFGGKTFRACHDCLEALTALRLQLLTTPEMDSVERYV